MMLKFFRKKNVAKMVLWGILILILPAFVIWGSGSLGRPREKGPTFVGLINNKKVSFDEFSENLIAMRSLLVLNYFNQPKILDAFLANKPLVAKLAWDRLIMLKEAKKHKIVIPDKDVIGYIRSHPLFLRNGAFDDKLYGHVLRYNIGSAPRNFEEMIRNNLEIQNLNMILTKDITVSDDEVLKEYKKENEKYRISYLLVKTEDFLDKVKIDEKEARDYYEVHKTEFLLPLKEGEEKINRHAADFEDVKASIHSYLAGKEAAGLSFKYTEELRLKIKEFMEKGSFEEAVIKAGSKTENSSTFSIADYIEGIGEARPLAEAAANLKAGEISDPVRVRKGIIIFKITETQGIDEEKFESDKAEFAKVILEKKKAKAIDEWFSVIYLQNSLKIDLNEIDTYYR